MDTQDRIKGAGRFDRRVQLLKPTSDADDFNQRGAGVPVVMFDNYPAKRVDGSSKTDESLEKNVIAGTSDIEWELRYIPNLGIRTTWQLKDLYDNKVYVITAPPTEKGRGEGIRVMTRLIE